MRVAAGRAEDAEAIVELLRDSLGESLMPKSLSYWTWKHIDNPFGHSPVLLCWDESKLVGVRAFLRWDWCQGKERFPSVRAVDTATHPAYQGKGIFRKLTMALVDECKSAGVHLVFNTPNGQSKPGYLKMGWKEVGKLPIIVGLRDYLPTFSQELPNFSDAMAKFLDHPGLQELVDNHITKADKIVTAVSPQFLRWRYREVPVAKYYAIGVEHGTNLVGLAFFRLKPGRFGNELRITDSFAIDKQAKNDLRRQLKEFEKNMNATFVTQSGLKSNDVHQLRRHFDARVSRGPMVTVRGLARTDVDSFINFQAWSPSLGDLELF